MFKYPMVKGGADAAGQPSVGSGPATWLQGCSGGLVLETCMIFLPMNSAVHNVTSSSASLYWVLTLAKYASQERFSFARVTSLCKMNAGDACRVGSVSMK